MGNEKMIGKEMDGMSYSKIALTVNEASECSGVGRNNLRELIRWEKLPAIYIGNKVLILAETLETFLRLNEGRNLKNKYDVVATNLGEDYNGCKFSKSSPYVAAERRK